MMPMARSGIAVRPVLDLPLRVDPARRPSGCTHAVALRVAAGPSRRLERSSSARDRRDGCARPRARSSACRRAGSRPQKPNTCRSQRPSPDGIWRSQRPSRPNSWAVSSSSPWRRACVARKRVALTSVKVQSRRSPSRVDARVDPERRAVGRAQLRSRRRRGVPAQRRVERRRAVSPAAPSGGVPRAGRRAAPVAAGRGDEALVGPEDAAVARR